MKNVSIKITDAVHNQINRHLWATVGQPIRSEAGHVVRADVGAQVWARVKMAVWFQLDEWEKARR